MRKVILVVLLILAGGLVAIQFVQPDPNLGNLPQKHDMLNTLEVPEQVLALLKNSCYDCHSNHTRYPWYSKISPVSWYLSRHIEAGKKAVNFSEFGQFKQRKKIGTLSSICEVLESASMPLKSFLILHRDASLEEEQVMDICNWSEAEALKIMKLGDDP